MQVVDHRPAIALLCDLRMRGGNHCRLREQDLNGDKANEQHTHESQQQYDSPVAPLESLSAS